MALTVLAGLSACATRPYAAYAIDDSTDAERIANVVVTESSLRDVVRVGSPVLERTPNGELRVSVPVRNIDDESIGVLAQVSFLDDQQRMIGDDTNRQVQFIPPGSTVLLDWVSRTEEASDFVLRLSWNK